MIAGLFWAAIVIGLYFLADYYTAPKEPAEQEARKAEKEQWAREGYEYRPTDRFDAMMLKFFAGVAVFFVVGYLFF